MDRFIIFYCDNGMTGVFMCQNLPNYAFKSTVYYMLIMLQ